jgi:uncharacterized membrane protein
MLNCTAPFAAGQSKYLLPFGQLQEERWMNRAIRAASWLLFAAVMYLILQAALSPWFQLPAPGNIGFTMVFVLFALIHCVAVEGLRRTSLFFIISAIVCYSLEEIGIRTGLIYGAYHYGPLLGPKLGHVPVIIPLAYFMMIYPSWMVARALLRGVDTHSVPRLTALAAVAALVMTAWDVVMDPGMAAEGNWVWEQGGVYFGVPRHNYLGWLLTTFLVYWITGLLWRPGPQSTAATRNFAALPVIVYAFFAARYVAANSIAALQLIALFTMGIPAFVALLQLYLNTAWTVETQSTS